MPISNLNTGNSLTSSGQGSRRQENRDTSTRRDPSHWEDSSTTSRITRRTTTTRTRSRKQTDAMVLGSQLLQLAQTIGNMVQTLEQKAAKIVESSITSIESASLDIASSQGSQRSISTRPGSQTGLAHPLQALQMIRGHSVDLTRQGTPFSQANSQ
jgi:hypothetical protein